ncbi:MAG: NrfD/PsrC family molybdoenzyme membrane anchor subunit [Gammaproteobacteria bacterium]|nr:NrfD/PsrC family molybdoenzyme membrane anchor subunit [Gammaproteobacteria bacterium]
MKKIEYTKIKGQSVAYYGLLAGLGFLILMGLIATWYMEHNGHYVTGMNNHIVWGMPHIFAVFLIVAASGALNVASISSVFGKKMYDPLSRLSALLAIALLAGGLVVLLLDLGRPDRLIVAITTYNFKSIFAWNIILYTGFFAVVGAYIWMMMDHSMYKFKKKVGKVAFAWRLVLTTGTGSIFGFLVARSAYDAAIMAPMFIIMSFAFGLAIFLLILMAAYNWTGRELGDVVVTRLRNLLGVFVAASLFITAIYHLTNLYITQHHGVEAFILADGGIYTNLFWIGQVFLGGLLPLALIYAPSLKTSRNTLGLASALIIIGGFCQMYVIIIGGQAYPLEIFPGYEVSNAFFGAISQYSPSLPEIMLGLSGVAVSLLLVTFAIKVLRFLPASLSDSFADPNATK